MQTAVNAADPIAVANETGRSGVSWAAILAGAAAAAALSYVLIILGFGLGLSSVSPWSGSGADAGTIGIATILWLAFTQIAAAGMGGYLAGRLRVKWTYLIDDEVYFRDTAHGFLSWAVASLVVAIFLATAIGNVLGGGAQLAGSALSGAGNVVGASANAIADNVDVDSGYFVDTLLRDNAGAGAATTAPANNPVDSANGVAPDSPTANEPVTQRLTNSSRPRDSDSTARGEVTAIFANAIRTGSLDDADRSYLAQMVARQTGVSEAEAEQRVDAGYTNLKQGIDTAKTKAKEAADAARKAAAWLALWLFVTLLCGAFAASFMAIFGGRRRDAAYPAVR
ncbi:MAG: hypothetical protein WBP11_10850 [Dokdonella sp.]